MNPDSAKLLDLEEGTNVGEYVVMCKIGEGGMGQVYAGEQPMIGKQVAIKVLSSELAQDPSLEQRLLEEARAVNLIRHPNIIDIFSFGTLPDGRPYFVMEYLEGENLEDALCHNTLLATDLTALVEQLCQGLGAAHAAGFVHRDLKPENLWLVRRPEHPPFLKILDFGIAKNTRLPAPGLTTNGQVMGTAHYMAPEQVLAQGVDARTDIYAVGVILYRILAGVLPFDALSTYAIVSKHVSEQAQPISSHRAVPAELEAVVMRCLAKDPAERPQTASQLWRELKPALQVGQAVRSDVGLAETLWAPAQSSTVVGPSGAAESRQPLTRLAALGDLSPLRGARLFHGKVSTLDPLGAAESRSTRVGRHGNRLVVAGIAAAITILGGIGLWASRVGSGPHQPSLPTLVPSSRDGALLNTPTSAPQPLPVQVQGERDGGAGGGPARSPSRPSAPHPGRKTTRDNAYPIRL